MSDGGAWAKLGRIAARGDAAQEALAGSSRPERAFWEVVISSRMARYMSRSYWGLLSHLSCGFTRQE